MSSMSILRACSSILFLSTAAIVTSVTAAATASISIHHPDSPLPPSFREKVTSFAEFQGLTDDEKYRQIHLRLRQGYDPAELYKDSNFDAAGGSYAGSFTESVGPSNSNSSSMLQMKNSKSSNSKPNAKLKKNKHKKTHKKESEATDVEEPEEVKAEKEQEDMEQELVKDSGNSDDTGTNTNEDETENPSKILATGNKEDDDSPAAADDDGASADNAAAEESNGTPVAAPDAAGGKSGTAGNGAGSGAAGDGDGDGPDGGVNAGDDAADDADVKEEDDLVDDDANKTMLMKTGSPGTFTKGKKKKNHRTITTKKSSKKSLSHNESNLELHRSNDVKSESKHSAHSKTDSESKHVTHTKSESTDPSIHHKLKPISLVEKSEQQDLDFSDEFSPEREVQAILRSEASGRRNKLVRDQKRHAKEKFVADQLDEQERKKQAYKKMSYYILPESPTSSTGANDSEGSNFIESESSESNANANSGQVNSEITAAQSFIAKTIDENESTSNSNSNSKHTPMDPKRIHIITRKESFKNQLAAENMAAEFARKKNAATSSESESSDSSDSASSSSDAYANSLAQSNSVSSENRMDDGTTHSAVITGTPKTGSTTSEKSEVSSTSTSSESTSTATTTTDTTTASSHTTNTATSTPESDPKSEPIDNEQEPESKEELVQEKTESKAKAQSKDVENPMDNRPRPPAQHDDTTVANDVINPSPSPGPSSNTNSDVSIKSTNPDPTSNAGTVPSVVPTAKNTAMLLSTQSSFSSPAPASGSDSANNVDDFPIKLAPGVTLAEVLDEINKDEATTSTTSTTMTMSDESQTVTTDTSTTTMSDSQAATTDTSTTTESDLTNTTTTTTTTTESDLTTTTTTTTTDTSTGGNTADGGSTAADGDTTTDGDASSNKTTPAGGGQGNAPADSENGSGGSTTDGDTTGNNAAAAVNSQGGTGTTVTTTSTSAPTPSPAPSPAPESDPQKSAMASTTTVVNTGPESTGNSPSVVPAGPNAVAAPGSMSTVTPPAAAASKSVTGPPLRTTQNIEQTSSGTTAVPGSASELAPEVNGHESETSKSTVSDSTVISTNIDPSDPSNPVASVNMPNGASIGGGSMPIASSESGSSDGQTLPVIPNSESVASSAAAVSSSASSLVSSTETTTTTPLNNVTQKPGTGSATENTTEEPEGTGPEVPEYPVSANSNLEQKSVVPHDHAAADAVSNTNSNTVSAVPSSFVEIDARGNSRLDAAQQLRQSLVQQQQQQLLLQQQNNMLMQQALVQQQQGGQQMMPVGGQLMSNSGGNVKMNLGGIGSGNMMQQPLVQAQQNFQQGQQNLVPINLAQAPTFDNGINNNMNMNSINMQAQQQQPLLPNNMNTYNLGAYPPGSLIQNTQMAQNLQQMQHQHANMNQMTQTQNLVHRHNTHSMAAILDLRARIYYCKDPTRYALCQYKSGDRVQVCPGKIDSAYVAIASDALAQKGCPVQDGDEEDKTSFNGWHLISREDRNGDKMHCSIRTSLFSRSAPASNPTISPPQGLLDVDEITGTVVDFRSSPSEITGGKYDMMLEPIDRWGNVVWKIRAVCVGGNGECTWDNHFIYLVDDPITGQEGILKLTPSQADAAVFLIMPHPTSTGSHAISDMYMEEEKRIDCANKVTYAGGIDEKKPPAEHKHKEENDGTRTTRWAAVRFTIWLLIISVIVLVFYIHQKKKTEGMEGSGGEITPTRGNRSE